jgi:hypothetical protein
LPALTSAGDSFCDGATSLTSLSLPALTSTGIAFCGSATSLKDLSLPALASAENDFCYGATSLTNLSFGGRVNVLTIDDLTINSPNLTVDSLVALGTALKAGTGTFTFNATAWGRLSDTQKAIFTNKGYTVTTTT